MRVDAFFKFSKYAHLSNQYEYKTRINYSLAKEHVHIRINFEGDKAWERTVFEWKILLFRFPQIKVQLELSREFLESENDIFLKVISKKKVCETDAVWPIDYSLKLSMLPGLCISVCKSSSTLLL